MLARIIGAGILLASASAVVASPENTFNARDVFALQVATDPQISPDGRTIAYVRNSGDIMLDRMFSSIWLVDTRTGEQRPLAASERPQSSPRWSPDGRSLAYVGVDDSKRSQLFVHRVNQSGELRLTTLAEEPQSLQWSPDGRYLAYLMFVPSSTPDFVELPEKPAGAEWAPPLQVVRDLVYRTDSAGYLRQGREQLFIVPAAGGAPRQLTNGQAVISGPLSWSADGTRIYYSANADGRTERDRDNWELYALDLRSTHAEKLTERLGPDFNPVASPDGSRLAYLGYDEKDGPSNNVLLYVMDIATGRRRALSGSLDRSISAIAWAPDGRSILAVYGDRAEEKLARISLEGQIRTVATRLGGTELDRPYYEGASFTVARDGSIATTLDSDSRPPEVAIVRGQATRRLTRLNDDLLSSRALGLLQKLPVRSSVDGRPIDAWLTLPPGYRPGTRVPLILEIHGGPVSAYGARFSSDNQLYAASGYAVLYANPRGSATYGDEFANLIANDYPGHDYDDLMSAVDSAIAAGIADPDQLFVTGGSGGGILTAWIVGKTNRFRAAAAVKPVANWTSMSLTTDEVGFVRSQMFRGMPWENPEDYWRRSPLSLVKNVKTPTLVLVGSEDFRTPVSEAEQLYSALKLQGVPTVLVKVPGANHDGLQSRPSNSAGKALSVLAWFNRYREPKRTGSQQ